MRSGIACERQRASFPRVFVRLGNSSGREYKRWAYAPTESGGPCIRPIDDEQIERVYISEFRYCLARIVRRRDSVHLQCRPYDLLKGSSEHCLLYIGLGISTP
jgi:hypothetical protein